MSTSRAVFVTQCLEMIFAHTVHRGMCKVCLQIFIQKDERLLLCSSLSFFYESTLLSFCGISQCFVPISKRPFDSYHNMHALVIVEEIHDMI